jgi:SPP1 gp7 family putative phage head morphogenesis protein
MRRELTVAVGEGQRDLSAIITRNFLAVSDILADGMALSFLLGTMRTGALAYRHDRRVGVQFSIYTDPLAVLFGRMALQPNEIAAIQQNFGKRARETLLMTATALDRRLKPVVSDLVTRGIDKRTAVKELREEVAKAGLGPTKTYQLEAIYRTQTQIAHSAGRWQAQQAPEIQSILWGYEYVTVGDDRVREEHAVLDGTTRPKNDPFWLTHTPPLGWNCRCQLLEVYTPESIRNPAETPPVPPAFQQNFGQTLMHAVNAAAIVSRAIQTGSVATWSLDPGAGME